MVKILPHALTLDFHGRKIPVDTVELDEDIIYKVNLPEPLFIKRGTDDKGYQCWKEEGAGKTPQASELGDLIEQKIFMDNFHNSFCFII
jgi:hypothetical protein